MSARDEAWKLTPKGKVVRFLMNYVGYSEELSEGVAALIQDPKAKRHMLECLVPEGHVAMMVPGDVAGTMLKWGKSPSGHWSKEATILGDADIEMPARRLCIRDGEVARAALPTDTIPWPQAVEEERTLVGTDEPIGGVVAQGGELWFNAQDGTILAKVEAMVEVKRA